MSEEKMNLSRRNFLRGGIIGVGALAVGAGIFAPFNDNVVKAAEITGSGDIPNFPWPYVQLDAEKAKEAAYLGYGKYKCSYGAFNAIISQLKEKVGYPYTSVPTEVLQWGGTGGAGWATLCGSLIGASTAINYVIGSKKEVDKVVSELYGWYTTHEFPQYTPPATKVLEYEGELAKSKAGSVLCHVSVGKWCDASKLKAEGKERSERCGRLTADVAAKTVELLNNYFAKTFATAYKDTQSVQECMVCHGPGRSLEDARGKMDCIQCHTTIKPNDLLEHIKQSWEIVK